MIRQKVIIIFMVVYLIVTVTFFAFGSLLSPFISRLAPAAAAATGSGGGFTIPAKIIATTTGGGNVAKWVSLLVPGATGAKVAIALTGIAGALAADYIFEQGKQWFQGEGFKQDANGNWTQDQNQNIPDGFTWSDYNGTGTVLYNPGYQVTGHGVFPDVSAAAAARDAYKAANCPSGSGSSYSNLPGPSKAVTVVCPGSSPGDMHAFFYPYPNYPTHPEPVPVPTPQAAVEAALAAALANENPNAKDVVKAALEVAGNALDNPDHPVAKNKTVSNSVNNALVGNLTPTQTSNLEAAATPNVGDGVLPDTDETKVETLTAAQIAAAVAAALANQGLSATQIAAAIAAVQTAQGGLTAAETTAAVSASLQGQGLTAAQIAAAVAAANPALTQTAVQTAVKSALDDDTGVPPVVDPTIVIPEKLSLTVVMQNFVDAIYSLPIFATLNGITINVSGSSTLCINLPSNLGGSKCWNGSNMQDGLNMIGSAFLGLTSIISFIGIFKG